MRMMIPRLKKKALSYQSVDMSLDPGALSLENGQAYPKRKAQSSKPFRSLFLALFLGICSLVFLPASTAHAKDPAHPVLRGFAEFGMGAVTGTVVSGTTLITGLLLNPGNWYPTLITSAILYPGSIESGAILGGLLTDSKSGYWQPFFGAYAGALIADITAYFLVDDYPIFSALLVLITPIVTTVVAMETSHYWKNAKKPEQLSLFRFCAVCDSFNQTCRPHQRLARK